MEAPKTLNEFFRRDFQRRLSPQGGELLNLDVNGDGYSESPQKICLDQRRHLSAWYSNRALLPFTRIDERVFSVISETQDAHQAMRPEQNPEIVVSDLAHRFLSGLVLLFGSEL